MGFPGGKEFSKNVNKQLLLKHQCIDVDNDIHYTDDL